MKKYILIIAVALTCTTAFAYDDGTPMYTRLHIPPVSQSTVPITIPPLPYTGDIPKATYQPWAYMPIQVGGNGGGSAYGPGSQPASQSSGNTYVLW